IMAEGLDDRDYIARYTTGIDGLGKAAEEWTPEATERATGVPAEQVTDLALQYARTRPAIIRYGVGMQRARGAGFALQALWCLPALTGQWRHPAGGVADARSMLTLNLTRLQETQRRGPQPRMLSMIQLGRLLTDPDLDPPVRGLFVWNSNPAVVAADQRRVLAGLAREDLFCVVHEQFLTDTARYADIVLPATTMLENEDLLGSWGFNYIGLNERAIEPCGEAVSNTELARRLAARFGFDDDLFRLTDAGLIDLALSGSAAEQAGATRQRLASDGFVRIGAAADVAPYAEGGFPGPTGKWEFTSTAFAHAGLEPTPVYVPPAESPETAPELARRFPLRLLTLKRHFSINSSYAALPVLLGAEPEALIEIHPADAAQRGIEDGATARLWNDRGELIARVRVTDDLSEGTVAVPFGRWLRDGAGANALTSDRLSDIGNGPTFCDALVEVEVAPPAP
ncbi:MAG: molybdopterin-dependent oxidoreductase, partial [Actinobacteria bacterium]|nr:molybdopterin-dependent oxidoreductase [Actinomycetota bacterium]